MMSGFLHKKGESITDQPKLPTHPLPSQLDLTVITFISLARFALLLVCSSSFSWRYELFKTIQGNQSFETATLDTFLI